MESWLLNEGFKKTNDRKYTCNQYSADYFNKERRAEFLLALQVHGRCAYSISSSGPESVPAKHLKKRQMATGIREEIEFGGDPFKITFKTKYSCRAGKLTHQVKDDLTSRTCKQGCTASIIIYECEVAGNELKELNERLFIVVNDCHTIHQAVGTQQRASPLVMDLIREYKCMGITNRQQLAILVETKITEYLEERNLPVDRQNRCVFPHKVDYKNAKPRKVVSGVDDHVRLLEMEKQWRAKGYSTHYECKENEASTATNKEPPHVTLLIQSPKMKQLLRLYNREFLMDDTHGTNNSKLSLFLITVKTPYGYQVAALFFVSQKTSEVLTPVLQRIRSWNPEWSPSVSMTDCDAAELKSIIEVFPSITRLICDWHWKEAIKKQFAIIFKDLPDSSLLRQRAYNFEVCWYTLGA